MQGIVLKMFVKDAQTNTLEAMAPATMLADA